MIGLSPVTRSRGQCDSHASATIRAPRPGTNARYRTAARVAPITMAGMECVSGATPDRGCGIISTVSIQSGP